MNLLGGGCQQCDDIIVLFEKLNTVKILFVKMVYNGRASEVLLGSWIKLDEAGVPLEIKAKGLLKETKNKTC